MRNSQNRRLTTSHITQSVAALVLLLFHILHELLVLQREPDGLVLLVDLVGAVYEAEGGHAEEGEDAGAERLPDFSG